MYRIAICCGASREGHEICALSENILDARGIEAKADLFSNPGLFMSAVCSEPRYDLYLLDISPGRGTDLDLAGRIRAIGDTSPMILISSDASDAIAGYKVRADDYLLKPVTQDVLDEALTRLLKIRKTVLFRTREGSLRPIETGSIIWAEAFVHHTEIHTEKDVCTIRALLSEVIAALHDGRFLRCHRSYMINLDHVTDLGKSAITMADGRKIPISRGTISEVAKAMNVRFRTGQDKTVHSPQGQFIPNAPMR
ncbi:MAG: LytTR family DNA-binding domain-containing protein [Lachnospiraceae bacterium]|nr:LytTR family DNA-binding domain-containing protein [Lachnospiraceae bacterium]